MTNWNTESFDSKLEECKTILERIKSRRDFNLQGANMYIEAWQQPDTIYRIRVSPKDVTYVSDIGPAFKSLDELKAFLRGLEITNKDIEVKAQN